MTAAPPPSVLARPLDPVLYAPYGDVIAAGRRGEPGRPANQGTARRFDRLATLVNARGAAAPLNVCAFRCEPRTSFPLPVHLLERHPGSTQIFVPMSARRFLVVVATGGAAPDLATLAAFVVSGPQGVSYHAGVWHHPMIALDERADFACLVHEDGGPGDCEEVRYDPGAQPRIHLTPETA